MSVRAFLATPHAVGGRIYLCDADAHCVNVLSPCGQPIFSFGGRGSGPGQFEEPSDIAPVWIEAADAIADMDTDGAPSLDSLMLAVSDRGNHRVQLFELDGSPLGVVGGDPVDPLPCREPSRAGWPFFRIGGVPLLPFPSRLQWRPPYLDVTCASSVVRVDLASALLPDFDAWIAGAPLEVLCQAFDQFTVGVGGRDVPVWHLYEIAERLQAASRRARGLTRKWA
jgi:hypothetical protein